MGKEEQYESNNDKIVSSFHSIITDENIDTDKIFDIKCTAVHSDADDILGYVTIFNDITELIALLDKLNNAKLLSDNLN